MPPSLRAKIDLHKNKKNKRRNIFDNNNLAVQSYPFGAIFWVEAQTQFEALKGPPMPNSIHLLPSRQLPCAFCQELLSREDLFECASCGLLYCGSRQNECQCRCGIPTTEEALAAA